MFRFNKLTDIELCQVNKVFEDCSEIEVSNYIERYEKLKSICPLFKDSEYNTEYLLEWLEEYNDEHHINSIIIYKRMDIIFEMGKRFYEKNLEYIK